jgi:hypothetical protein
MAQQAASSAVDSAAQDLVAQAGKAVVWAMSWWTTTSTIDPNDAVVRELQHTTLPVVGLILVGSVLWQALLMVLSRKPTPLVNVASGLVRYAAVCTAGLAFWEVIVWLSDAVTSSIVSAAAGDFGTTLAAHTNSLFTLKAILAGLLALVLFVLSVIQWILGFVRLAGIEVLAVLLPLAAAGSITESTRPWLRKINSWLITLVAYKPAAALIYAIGFKLLVGPLPGDANSDMQPVSRTMIGIMVLLLAVFALPIMLKFLAPFGADSSGGGLAGALLGGAAGAAGAVKLTGMLGGGAVSSAARIQRSGPGTGGPAPTPGPTPMPGPPSPTPGPTPTPGPAPGAGASAGVAANGTAAAGSAAGGTAAGSAAAGSTAAAAGPAGVAAAAAMAAAAQVKKHAQGFGGQPPQGGTP